MMKPVIDLNRIETVLLDMDGTLLDLHFDNYFWQHYLPQYWADFSKTTKEKARQALLSWYAEESGKLPWYCLDFWSERLGFDVFSLKFDIEEMIKIRPHADIFLNQLSESACRVIMVTNAHQKLLKMKMDKTNIDIYFDQLISSHDIGYAKEEQAFWQRTQEMINFDPERTLLVDDNLTVLRAARQFGIKHLLTIIKPDSQAPEQDPQEFDAIDAYIDVNFIMPDLKPGNNL